MACDRVGYALTCVKCWPNDSARWCDSCFDRFAPKQQAEDVPRCPNQGSMCNCTGKCRPQVKLDPMALQPLIEKIFGVSK